MKIILASGSPRRKELLTLGGFKYEVIVSNVEEIMDEQIPHKLVMSLAGQKARAVAAEQNIDEDTVVIGADTVVACGERILGKPHSKDEAREMIKLISGRDHEVYTGVALVRKGHEPVLFYEKSLVKVIKLTDEEIEEYISLAEPYDKAGGYAIQGAFAKYISGIDGDYYNIMGFPLCRIACELKKLG